MKDLSQFYGVIIVGLLVELGVCQKEVGQAFVAYKIVPDTLDVPPTNKAEVYYPETNQAVNLGTEASPNNVQKPPEVYYESDASSYHTLMMIDPDAPQRQYPIYGQWLHWLVTNIPGTSVANGQVIADYGGPRPPQGGGLHRYIFLVYKQPRKLAFYEPYRNSSDFRGRSRFSAEDFAEKYGLAYPIAGNFFLAQYDGTQGKNGDKNTGIIKSVYVFVSPDP